VAAVADAVHGMDLLVTTGGASVGDHDLVIESLKTRGLKLNFWQIAMRPGKPLLFGTLGAVPVLGLPGNPVSALVCSILFLLPALNRLGGLPAAAPPTVQAVAGIALRANDHRADHLRATVTLDQRGRTWPRRSRCRIRRCCAASARRCADPARRTRRHCRRAAR
jgi:molybdopterin molybdotransferase